jgi:hypothetical protein
MLPDPTTPVTAAEDSYEWWRAEVARRNEALERLRAERDLLRETLAEADLGAQVLAQWEAIAAADADRDRLETERDALKAAIAEQTQRTLNAAADKLYALPVTDGAALKGPYWYRQGFTQAADLLRDWADYPAALAAPESHEDGEQCGDERPRLDGDERVIVCTLPKGHAAHRAAKYGTAWEYLRTEDAPTGGWLTWQKLMGTEPPPFSAVLENPDAPTEEDR